MDTGYNYPHSVHFCRSCCFFCCCIQI
jgi:hypothetical protein